jgi:hypothetical protein
MDLYLLGRRHFHRQRTGQRYTCDPGRVGISISIRDPVGLANSSHHRDVFRSGIAVVAGATQSAGGSREISQAFGGQGDAGPFPLDCCTNGEDQSARDRRGTQQATSSTWRDLLRGVALWANRDSMYDVRCAQSLRRPFCG